jgi:hypothetical protein
MFLTNIFYTIKPLIPRRLQILLRRQIIQYKRKKYSHIWPIDPNAGEPPRGWNGWPDNKKFAMVLSHDVETQEGHDKCYRLMEIEESLGFRSSFNIVPERYLVSQELIDVIKNRGFEVSIHGLKHDGKLFSSRKIFERRSKEINQYIKTWGVEGFTTPSMLRNPEWIHELNIKHCISTFDTDPFEPQPDAAGTIFPFWVQSNSLARGYVEFPYTLPQDFTLFILMKKRNINIWKKKLDLFVHNVGMALYNSHPVYMNFNKDKKSFEEYPARFYEEFLMHMKSKYEGLYSMPLN